MVFLVIAVLLPFCCGFLNFLRIRRRQRRLRNIKYQSVEEIVQKNIARQSQFVAATALGRKSVAAFRADQLAGREGLRGGTGAGGGLGLGGTTQSRAAPSDMGSSWGYQTKTTGMDSSGG